MFLLEIIEFYTLKVFFFFKKKKNFFFQSLVSKKTPIPSVSTLPCLFSAFIQKYNLSPCETKEDQTWRRASGNKVVGHVNIFAKYFTELSLLIDSLNEYSVVKSITIKLL